MKELIAPKLHSYQQNNFLPPKFIKVAVKKCIERHTGRARILRLLIELHDEVFEMLTNGLLSLVNGRVEGLHLAYSLGAINHVTSGFRFDRFARLIAPCW